MKFITERRKEIEARKAELRAEIEKPDTEEKRLAEIKEEAEALNAELEELRAKEALEMTKRNLEPVTPAQRSAEPTVAERFAREGRMSIPMFREERALLVSTGNLATPTAVATEIGALPQTVCSILDDVDVFDATGTGTWEFPYQVTAATAADVTEGQKIGGTEGTYNYVELSSKKWGTLSEASNQISMLTPVAYANAVQKDAYLALRKKAKEEITKAILSSELAEKKENVKLDEKFIRTIVLGYDSDESVEGNAKLYINKADLATLGAVRGTQDKKPVYEISFTDANNGIIKDGGMAVNFSINASLETGVQMYGNPKTVKLGLWGKYEVKTDESGEYFAKDVMAIRGTATANAALCVKNGMQLINQATFMV